MFFSASTVKNRKKVIICPKSSPVTPLVFSGIAQVRQHLSLQIGFNTVTLFRSTSQQPLHHRGEEYRLEISLTHQLQQRTSIWTHTQGESSWRYTFRHSVRMVGSQKPLFSSNFWSASASKREKLASSYFKIETRAEHSVVHSNSLIRLGVCTHNSKQVKHLWKFNKTFTVYWAHFYTWMCKIVRIRST